MSGEEDSYHSRQLALNIATSETKTRAPAKKKSPLDRIRANQARTRATQAYVSGSAFTRLDEQNGKVAKPPRTVSFTDAGTPIHNWKIESEPANKITKPPPKKKPSAAKKKKVSVLQNFPVEKKVQPQPPVSEEAETESWNPAGGHRSSESIIVKSKSVGVARIPGWRVEKFTKELGELLLMEILADDEDFKILVKTEDEGLEKLTDVYVELESLARAEELRGMIDGRMLGGRALTVECGKQQSIS